MKSSLYRLHVRSLIPRVLWAGSEDARRIRDAYAPQSLMVFSTSSIAFYIATLT